MVDYHRLILEVIGPEQHHLLPIWVEGDLSVNRGGSGDLTGTAVSGDGPPPDSGAPQSPAPSPGPARQ